MPQGSRRVTEADLTVPALQVIRDQPDGRITTTKLISELRKVMNLSPGDEEKLEGRRDDHFSQIVRNIKSHEGVPGNLLTEGRLERIPYGFRITDAGRLYLKHNGI